ncbi:MAG: ABC-2 transporter permease [Clostridiales bacterium]|nr:ABC-2 transporter permease [Clostridiales bacterium]
MKGLLLKDLYTLAKQMRLFMLLIALFACIPGYSLPAFAVVYAAMLPFTALAYDERARWDELAATMPYSTRRIVWSKYLLGGIFIAAAMTLLLAAQLVTALAQRAPFSPESACLILSFGAVALTMQAINLPLIFRLGSEKGRFAFMLLIVVVAAAIGLGEALEFPAPGRINLPAITAAALLAALALTAASASLSERLYRRRRA